MLEKFKKFTVLPIQEKKLFIEAYLMLGVMRAAILTLSFKYLTRSLRQKLHQKPEALNEAQSATASLVGSAISRAAGVTPWESACLVQSLTAQKMLQKRKVPGVFYLGVAKDDKSKEKMKAHAWTQCGELMVTGKSGHENFTVVSVFGWSA